jgi:hypothetical protein
MEISNFPVKGNATSFPEEYLLLSCSMLVTISSSIRSLKISNGVFASFGMLHAPAGTEKVVSAGRYPDGPSVHPSGVLPAACRFEHCVGRHLEQ